MADDEETTEAPAKSGITLTLEKLMVASRAAVALASQQYPLKLGFRIATLRAALDAPAERFERMKIERVRQAADKDDAGNAVKDETGNYKLDPAVQRAIETELEEAIAEEVTVDTRALRATDFGKDARITPGLLVDLGPFFIMDT